MGSPAMSEDYHLKCGINRFAPMVRRPIREAFAVGAKGRAR
jgi:hypothetical protein